MWPCAAHTSDKPCLNGAGHINQDEMLGSQPWHWGMQALKEEEDLVWQALPGGQECSYCSRCSFSKVIKASLFAWGCLPWR